jgi:hypothetical protein
MALSVSCIGSNWLKPNSIEFYSHSIPYLNLLKRNLYEP